MIKILGGKAAVLLGFFENGWSRKEEGQPEQNVYFLKLDEI